mmetsp:Transcript_45695/g.142974  ORF Transcript_45695/g.142974 Transcript_45695/m.142974 type:complete len:394 (-) Transcript_45695:859-2040(-)
MASMLAFVRLRRPFRRSRRMRSARRTSNKTPRSETPVWPSRSRTSSASARSGSDARNSMPASLRPTAADAARSTSLSSSAASQLALLYVVPPTRSFCSLATSSFPALIASSLASRMARRQASSKPRTSRRFRWFSEASGSLRRSKRRRPEALASWAPELAASPSQIWATSCRNSAFSCAHLASTRDSRLGHWRQSALAPSRVILSQWLKSKLLAASPREDASSRSVSSSTLGTRAAVRWASVWSCRATRESSLPVMKFSPERRSVCSVRERCGAMRRQRRPASVIFQQFDTSRDARTGSARDTTSIISSAMRLQQLRSSSRSVRAVGVCVIAWIVRALTSVWLYRLSTSRPSLEERVALFGEPDDRISKKPSASAPSCSRIAIPAAAPTLARN